MTKQRKTNYMENAWLKDWIATNLPDSSTGYMVSDIDLMIQNYKNKKIMFLEVKCNMADPEQWQKYFLKRLHNWIKKGIYSNWKYLGCHLLQFENASFNGKLFLNRKEISEQDLIKFLSQVND